MRTVDAIVVGSGHNALAAAAYLARAGWEVEVLERNPVAGGNVTSAELTGPGYVHDTWASWHSQFTSSRTWAELGPELEERGLSYANTDSPAASVLPDGETVLARRSLEETAAVLPDDADAYLREIARTQRRAPYIGAMLASELRSREGLAGAARLVRGLGPAETARITRDLGASARSWLAASFGGRAVPALAIPWILHAGLTPDSTSGRLQLPFVMLSKHNAGSPVVRGGGARFAQAFERLIGDHGGRLRTGAEVREIVIKGGRAVGVRTAAEEIGARRAVIAGVSPTQLYLDLLPDGAAPRRAVRQASGFRPGLGCMMIHVALRQPLRWRDPRLDQVAQVHVTDGVDGVARGCTEAAAGLLPARPTICVGQQTALDPSRAPVGAGTLWIQLLATPYAPQRDAAGEIGLGGGWTEEAKGAYCDRVLGLIAPHVEAIDLAHPPTVLSPPELEAANVNCRAGDPSAGSTELRQSLVFRPLRSYGRHRTPVPGLWQIGASTHPGPGLHAASGRMVALELLGSAGPAAAVAEQT